MDIPNHLTALAADINAVLARDTKNRVDWIEIKLDMCRLFAEARTKFKDDRSFGKWFAEVIGRDRVNANDQTAYTAMGADLKLARTVLEKTTRWSIQHIYENEFKNHSTHVSGPPKPAPTLKPKTATEAARDAEIISRRDRGEAVADISSAIGLGERRVDRIIQDEKLRRVGIAEGRLEDAPLSASAQAKLDAHKRKLERDFEYRVQAEVIKRSEQAEARLRERWEERAGKLETAWQRRGKVFTKAEFNKLLRVVHPDTGPHVSDDERNEAMRLLNERKIKLLDDEAFPVASTARSPLPRTREEMEKARAEVKAKNSARSKAAHAARKNSGGQHP